MNKKEIPYFLVIIPIILTVIFLILTVFYFHIPLFIPLLMGYFFTALIGFYYKASLKDIFMWTLQGIKSIAPIILILILIGVLIAIWSSSGTIDTLVYLGLATIQPKYIVVISFLVSAAVSMLLGTSVGTMSTVGVALIGVAHSLGVNENIVAGALVSGAFVGDRTSPLSSAAQINAYITGVNYYQQVSRLIKTILPVILITSIIYIIMGQHWIHIGVMSENRVLQAMDTLKQQYGGITYWTLLPPISILLLAFLRTPTRINLILGILIGAIIAYIFQGKTVLTLIKDGVFGFHHPSDKVFGGGWNMLHQISLIVVAGAFYGVLESTGMIQIVFTRLIKKVKNPINLVKQTMLISILSAILSSTQVIGIIVPGKLLPNIYKKMNLDSGLLYRSIADSGMVVSGLIPWNLNAILLGVALNIPVTAFIPYAVLLFILPLYSYTLFKMDYLKKEKTFSRNLAKKVE